MQEEKAFGQSLRYFRRLADLTQENLGLESGLTRNYISELELGLKSPSLRTIFKLCLILKVSPVELMADTLARISGANDSFLGK